MAILIEDEANNIREGYMFIQSNSVWRPWSMKAKYFILTKECLYCFKRRGDLDAIPSDVIPLDGAAVKIDEERRGMRKRYYIRMTSPRLRKSFNLFCFMLDERNDWLTSILSVLAGKFTDNGLKNIHTINTLNKENKRNTLLHNLEISRPMSISCMELTNLSVIPGPLSPSRTAVPIRKTFDTLTPLTQHKKKISSSSLDIAIRTDISLNTREYYANMSGNLKKSTLKNKSIDIERLSYKRPQSMTDLRSIGDDFHKTHAGSSETTPTLEKRKRKTKGLSFSMIGYNLNFRTASVDNLF